VQTFIPEEIMRQSSVVKEIIRKERAEERAQTIIQTIIKNIEFRLGALDEELKTRILAIQNEILLERLHRQSVLADKDEIEKEIIALSE